MIKPGPKCRSVGTSIHPDDLAKSSCLPAQLDRAKDPLAYASEREKSFACWSSDTKEIVQLCSKQKHLESLIDRDEDPFASRYHGSLMVQEDRWHKKTKIEKKIKEVTTILESARSDAYDRFRQLTRTAASKGLVSVDEHVSCVFCAWHSSTLEACCDVSGTALDDNFEFLSVAIREHSKTACVPVRDPGSCLVRCPSCALPMERQLGVRAGCANTRCGATFVVPDAFGRVSRNVLAAVVLDPPPMPLPKRTGMTVI
jgi:hypothetical protein